MIKKFDAIVIGIGHAGIESAVALAKKGFKTLALSISLDNVGFLACNPSIGGTAKGHLVCEVDALGGVMGIVADKTLTHLRMLNSSKGVAVQSLRGQVDKYKYHDYMKSLLESTPNLSLRQGEVSEIIVNGSGDKRKIKGVKLVNGLQFLAKVIVVATGVYLESCTITGDVIEEKGPSGFSRSNYLANSLRQLGFNLRRFKTGTPARVKKSSVDLDKLTIQEGENTPYSFCLDSVQEELAKTLHHCHLGYTNQDTHSIISKNLKKSPKYAGLIKGAGARYCPSVEDKIVRFSGKERHPFFLEPEGEKTEECYVQGLSTGLPASIQDELYRSIEGFENVEIMRDAYAIEYECIDPSELFASLESKAIKGLYFAGQINGTSGYEEAAAQGLVAGINAGLALEKKPPVILARENSYIGVLIDDLVVKGTDEPYRMMTSRSEYRLLLRQDNADLRLSEIGYKAGVLSEERYKKLLQKKSDIEKCKEIIKNQADSKKVALFLEKISEAKAYRGLTYEEIIKRGGVTFDNFTAEFDIFNNVSKASAYDVFIEIKYAGYIVREQQSAQEALRLSEMVIPSNTDFYSVHGLRLEAQEKLSKIRPLTIGQASRISGLNPADINVLIIKLTRK
ncbi:MAG: tRNA uridine-5-carboxymethylaminomethyl(34) synthesis enzyme MnmG [Firmicutes bacterium]|nr:tRNA uridine-5-carboxymethylaminomethyl(34) synthesis enzyme MnmG [Bacillota bacterium]